MNSGEFLTRATIWPALCAYAAAMMLCAKSDARRVPLARWLWTIGCILFLAHVVCAFSFFHHWSHAAARDETARQTAAVTGLRWGGGIWWNYLFAAAWMADVLWWWLAPASFARRPTWLTAIWHGFSFFMVFNGTVVFGTGPVRWFGGIVCGILAVQWWRGRKDE